MHRRHLPFAAAVLAWLLVGLFGSRHAVDLGNFAAISAIAGLGVGMLLGQCGIVNLAQGLFFGIGAYASAYLTVNAGAPVLVGIGCGLALSAALALALGWPILKLSGFFLALATLAIGAIGTVLFFEWDGITGGTLGIGGIPRLSVAGWSLDTPQRFHWLIWPLAALLMALCANLVDSRPGLALRAMRDAPAAAQVMAIELRRLRTAMFVLSAVLGALAGSLFAHYVSFVSVQSFGIERSIALLLIPVLAGARSVWGVTAGALLVTVLPELLSRFGDVHQMLFGLALVLVVTLVPEGLAGAALAWARKARKGQVA